MKNRIASLLAVLCLATAAHAQYSTSTVGSSTAAGEINSKPAIQSVSGDPNVAAAGTAGKDLAYDIVGHNWWVATVSGAPATWVRVEQFLSFSAGLTRTGASITCAVASGSVPGCVAASDFASFAAKMSNPLTTTGDLLISSSGSTPGRLAAGAADTFLQGQGAGVLPSFGALANCAATGQVPQYSTSTHLWSCHTLVVGDLPNATFTTLTKTNTLQSGSACVDAGSTDTYACDLSPAITSYVAGTRYRFKANTANTGAASINFNSLGALAMKKPNGGGIATDLDDNDIRAGQWVECVYDGTNCQMASQVGNQVLTYDPRYSAADWLGGLTSGGSGWFSYDVGGTSVLHANPIWDGSADWTGFALVDDGPVTCASVSTLHPSLSGIPCRKTKWATRTVSPLTSKGDIWGFSTVDARLGVGSNNQVLTADSTQPLGVKWAAPSFTSPLTTKGDLWGFSTADARLGVGTNGQVVTADSTQTLGVKWSTLTPTSVGLSNVTNNAQTQAATVPNTPPAAGQILVGDGAKYNPVTMTGSCTLDSAGSITCGSAPGVSYNTESSAVNTNISPVTMISSTSAKRSYTFDWTVSLTTVGIGCTGTSTVTLNAIFTNPSASGAVTLPLATVPLATGNGTLGFVASGADNILAKTGTSVSYSATSYTAGAGCTTNPTFQVSPTLVQLW